MQCIDTSFERYRSFILELLGIYVVFTCYVFLCVLLVDGLYEILCNTVLIKVGRILLCILSECGVTVGSTWYQKLN